MLELLKSKRVVVVVLTFLALILAKFGFDLGNLEELAEVFIAAVSAIAIVVTKVIDIIKSRGTAEIAG